MSENLFDLYSQKILALAMEIPHQTPLESYDARFKTRSPVCGSQVEVSIAAKDMTITAYSQDVKACALGQASAAIFGKAVIGASFAQIERLHKEMESFLYDKDIHPSSPFGDYETLTPAQDYKNRHASIMLPINATLGAINSIKKAAL